MSSGESHRKLTVIFSADVKGYSRLMEDDEAATVETLKAYRQVLSDSVRAQSPSSSLPSTSTSTVSPTSDRLRSSWIRSCASTSSC